MGPGLFVCLLAGLFFPTCSGDGHAHWGYTGEHGPENWAEMYPTCGGEFQSPVDIDMSALVKDDFLTPFTFNGFDTEEGVSLVLQNNGHSAQVTYEAGNLLVSDGGLGGVYKVAQFHFHWGADDSTGSEHTVDGAHFPMEMHIVMYNTKYGDMGNAGDFKDGLAVLGIFFEAGSEDNTNYDTLIKALGDVTDPGTQVSVPAMKLENLLPEKTDQFVRYSGSLTTPPCSEVVTWTHFQTPVSISSDQLAQFRTLISAEEGQPLVNNFRPVQPLNGREIRVTSNEDK